MSFFGYNILGFGGSAPIPPYGVEYLIVAGGGAGGDTDGSSPGGGGAGAGGLLTNLGGTAIEFSVGTTYTQTVGGGGGGAGGAPPDPADTDGGAGGSGVVILKIPTANYTGTVTGSPTVTTSGDYRIVKFTGTGNYTA